MNARLPEPPRTHSDFAHITNAEFLGAIFGTVKPGERIWTASFECSPTDPKANWGGFPHQTTDTVQDYTRHNAYFSVATVRDTGQGFKRRSEQFVRMPCVVLDDAPSDTEASWLLETSAGNHQAGFILSPEIIDVEVASRLQKELARQGLVKADTNGYNPVRYVRLPQGVNTKHSPPFKCRLVDWIPDVVYSLDDLAERFALNLQYILHGNGQGSDSPAKGAAGLSGERESDEALIQAIVTGERYHDPLLSMAARLRYRGHSERDVVATVQGYMYAVPPSNRDERWQSRFDDVPRLVRGAFERYEAKTTQANEFGMTDPETGEIVRTTLLTPVAVEDVFRCPPAAPAFVWDNYLPRGVVTLFGAHGGTGKSTVALMLAVAVAIDRPLFGVHTNPNNVIFASLEDNAAVVAWRLATICRHWQINPDALAERLTIVDGTEHPELFSCEGRNAGASTPTFSELHRLATEANAGLVIVDNASDAYGGDEIQRRQVRAFMRLLGGIAKSLNAAVLLLAHVDKNTSRAGKAEGGEGYSGSTAWHNSARSRLFMSRAASGALTLEHQKSNLGRMQQPIELVWPEDGLPMLPGEAPDTSAMSRKAQQLLDKGRATGLLRLMAEFEGRGQYCHTGTTSRSNPFAVLKAEPAFQEMKLRQDDVKRIINQCQRDGWIVPVDYRTPDRKPHQRWTVTPAGLEFAGLPVPTAPTVPTVEDGATAEMAQGGAPTAPTGARGMGIERAHPERLSDGANEAGEVLA